MGELIPGELIPGELVKHGLIQHGLIPGLLWADTPGPGLGAYLRASVIHVYVESNMAVGFAPWGPFAALLSLFDNHYGVGQR